MPSLEALPRDRGLATCVLIPIFNDWAAAESLLRLLDGALHEARREANVLILDDASTEPRGVRLESSDYKAIRSVRVLELRRNLGHQRALAVGLAYVDAHQLASTVVVMDGDGEDAPADVPKLLDRFDREHRQQVVFAERRRRSESLLFRIFYWLYRVSHLVMTGRRVRVGNFSVLPGHLLHRLVVVSELWNHYAAAVFKARLPYVTVPTARANRLDGRSSMSYVSLVVHGLSAMSVYNEIIGVRALAATFALILLSAIGILAIVWIRVFTALAIPGWATTGVGVLLVVLLQAVLFSMVFSFMTLANRQGHSFLPARDFRYFVGHVVDVYQRPA